MRVRANGLPHNLSVSDCFQHWMEPAVVRLRSATYVLLFPFGTSMRFRSRKLLAGTLGRGTFVSASRPSKTPCDVWSHYRRTMRSA
jgi:hypothetical protein